MVRIGNLFDLAEKRLIMEQKEGKILFYTESDIIEYAIEIRKWLDKNPKKIKEVLKLTEKQLKVNHRKAVKRYSQKRKARK